MPESTLTAALVIRAQAGQALKSLGEVNAAVKGLRGTVKNVSEGLASLGAGAALGEFFKSSVGEAIQSQAENARVMTATISDGANAIANMAAVQKMAIETSSKLAISQNELKESYTLARYSGLSNIAAQRAAVDSARLAIATTKSVAEAQSQVAETTRMVGASFEIFGDKTKDARKQIDAISDAYAMLQSRSNFANAGELNSALSEALGTSKAYNVSLAQQNSILETLANNGKFSSMAGEAYEEIISKLSASNKKMYAMAAASDGDVVKELGMIRQATAAMSSTQRAAWFAAHGFELRSAQGLSILLDQYPKLVAAQTAYAHAAGMNQRLFRLRANSADEQIAVAANAYANFKETLGLTLIPLLTRAMRAAADLFRTLQGFAEAHPVIAEIALGFLGVSAALVGVSGALQILGVGKTLTYAWAAATKVATAAQWLLNAAMNANPILRALTIILLLATAAYELYEHWAGVKAFFVSIWSDIRTGAAALGSFFKQWGLEILGFIVAPWAMLPYEIDKHWGEIKNAATSIAHGIARLFVGHSPIPEGPLHNLNLGRQIALSFHPTELANAARRAAAGVALAIPLAMASPALAASAAPALAMVGSRAAGSNASPINFSPTININNPGQGVDVGAIHRAVEDALARSGHELMRTLKREQQNRARLEF